MKCISPTNYKYFSFTNIMVFLVRVAITSYGIHFAWGERYNNLLEEYENDIGTNYYEI